jgi:hypothetical protein
MKMSVKKRKIENNAVLRFREAGKGFIIAKSAEGMPQGRKLAKTFFDQYDRRHVQIDGNIELVSEQHHYFGAD